MLKKLCTIIILITMVSVLLYLKQTTEGLQNIGTGASSDNLKERGAIPYLEIHDMLTTDPDNSGVGDKLKAIISSVNDENDPYSWEDLESNLTSNSTIDDFKYFNNASNIYTGYAYKPNYMNL